MSNDSRNDLSEIRDSMFILYFLQLFGIIKDPKWWIKAYIFLKISQWIGMVLSIITTLLVGVIFGWNLNIWLVGLISVGSWGFFTVFFFSRLSRLVKV